MKKGGIDLLFGIISLSVLFVFLLCGLLAMSICFFRIFYSDRNRQKSPDEYPIPDGDIYLPHKEQMVAWIKEAREREHTDITITSHDGLKLSGSYFEYEKGAPIEILFHGYKGSAERDLSGGVYRCSRLGHSALIVDHRASGKSEGKVITFGAKESIDCLSWVEYVINNIDKDAKIILTGISMGAATVMTASSLPLPENVIGILADCGYTSTKEIVKKVMRDMKLPADILYPFARLGAIIFGGFDPDASSPIASMKDCHLPIIFFHGDTDDYVPCEMSQENFKACAARHKRLVTIPGAGHGLCFPADQETYLNELEDFFTPFL